ncbi:MAG: polysaccharide deacetylase family protein [Treponema sp.]|nr:polysaccharide deacetylase family protein [Treponema sp.]
MPPIQRIRVLALLLLGFLAAACASRPQPVAERAKEPPPRQPPAALPIPSHMELLVQRVKQNGTDITKYFILDNEGQILVRADLQNEIGEYEVNYDIESAEILADSAYSVRFYLREKGLSAAVEDTLIWKPVPGNSGLLLSMDDAFTDSWKRYFDLYDAYGARLTFFIQGEYTPFSNEAVNRGHDVGGHSLNHPDLRKISRSDFNRETIGQSKSFKDRGVVFSSFAFPYGFSEPWMYEILHESFEVLRGYGVTFRLYYEDEIRSGYIISRAIDNIVIPGEEQFDRLITLMLRTVKFLDDGRVLPLTSHDISDTADWGITPRRLEFLLKTAAELNLKFYRFSDF